MAEQSALPDWSLWFTDGYWTSALPLHHRKICCSSWIGHVLNILPAWIFFQANKIYLLSPSFIFSQTKFLKAQNKFICFMYFQTRCFRLLWYPNSFDLFGCQGYILQLKMEVQIMNFRNWATYRSLTQLHYNLYVHISLIGLHYPRARAHKIISLN